MKKVLMVAMLLGFFTQNGMAQESRKESSKEQKESKEERKEKHKKFWKKVGNNQRDFWKGEHEKKVARDEERKTKKTAGNKDDKETADRKSSAKSSKGKTKK